MCMRVNHPLSSCRICVCKEEDKGLRTAARREEKKNGGAAVVRLCLYLYQDMAVCVWPYAESGSSDEMEYALRPAKRRKLVVERTPLR